MAIIKDLFGNYAEAFNLLMAKKNAYDILKGIKKLEFRDFFSDRLVQVFFKETKDKKSPDYFVPRDIGCIHFHDYGNTFFLDVSIEAVDIIAVHPDNRDYFHKYGYHALDGEMDDLEAKKTDPKDPSVRWFVVMPITGIINTNLDLSSLPEGSVTAHDIPEDLQIPPEIAERKLAEQTAKIKAAKKK